MRSRSLSSHSLVYTAYEATVGVKARESTRSTSNPVGCHELDAESTTKRPLREPRRGSQDRVRAQSPERQRNPDGGAERVACDGGADLGRAFAQQPYEAEVAENAVHVDDVRLLALPVI